MSTIKRPTKKAPAKKAAKPTTAFSTAQLEAILNRLAAGKTGLIAEAVALGFNGSKQLHKALTALLGGREKYNAMLKRAIKARGVKKAPKATAKKVTKANGKKVTKTNGEKEETQPLQAVA